MLPISGHETYEDGQIIYEENSHGDWIYVIEYGQVELSRTVEGQKVVVQLLEPGQVFGALGYLSRERRETTAQTVGKTEVGIIDRMFIDEEFNKLSGRFRTILKAVAVEATRMIEMLVEEKARRRKPRSPLSFSLAFRDQKSLIKATSRDINGLGVFIKTDKPLEEGGHFNLKLLLPGHSEPLRLGCEVAWRRTQTHDPEAAPLGMGVKFIQITEEDRRQLEEAIDGKI
jgi:type IV pilus assembly protein PilZ